MNRFHLTPSSSHLQGENVPIIPPENENPPVDETQNALDNLHRLTHMLSYNNRKPPPPTTTTTNNNNTERPTWASNDNQSVLTNSNSNPKINALTLSNDNQSVPSNNQKSVIGNHQNGYALVNEQGEEEEEEEDTDEPESFGSSDAKFSPKKSSPDNRDIDKSGNIYPQTSRSTNHALQTPKTPDSTTPEHANQLGYSPPSPRRAYIMDTHNNNNTNTQPLFISNPTAYLRSTSSSPKVSYDNVNDDESDEMIDDLILSEKDDENDLLSRRPLITPKQPEDEINNVNVTPRQKSSPNDKTTGYSQFQSPENLEKPLTKTHNLLKLRRERQIEIDFEDCENPNPVLFLPTSPTSPTKDRLSMMTTSSNSTPPSPSYKNNDSFSPTSKHALLSPQKSVSSFMTDYSDTSSIKDPTTKRNSNSTSGILRRTTTAPSSSDYTTYSPPVVASHAPNDHLQTAGLHLDLNPNAKKNGLGGSRGGSCSGVDGADRRTRGELTAGGFEFGRSQASEDGSGGGGFSKMASSGRANQRGEYTPDTPSVMFSIGPRQDSEHTIATLEPMLGVSPLTGGSDKTAEVDEKLALANSKRQKASVLRESLFLILSSLYGILVVLIGAVIPITDVFVSSHMHSNFEVFYVYLYTVSLIFLVYVYAYLLRRNRFRNDFINRSSIFVRNLSRVWSRRDMGDASTPTPTHNNTPAHPHKASRRTISLDMSNHHTGTFYLRLGVLGFGMGSMIHCGLQFGSHFSLTEECSQKIQMIKPLLHMIFAFFQLYFIFMNSKMCIHRYKKLARFGLMHMCATNICVWFRSIVVETVHVIHSHNNKSHLAYGLHRGHDHIVHGLGHGLGHDDLDLDPRDSHSSSSHEHGDNTHHHHHNVLNNASHGHGHTTGSPHHAHTPLPLTSDPHPIPGGSSDYNATINCYWSEIMHKAAESAGPYLYPCSIEYSLMCACILYIMWKNVGQRPIRRETSMDMAGGGVGGDDSDNDKKRVHRMSVDCTSSSRGLFLGILTIVGSIISIIAFYMLVREPGLKHTAYVLTHVSETAVYLLTLIALIMASCKMKSFNFKVQQEAELEDILIVISYTGLVAFIVFSLMASIIHQASTSSILNIISNIAMLVQATLQTIFMLAGDRMSAANPEQVKRKPGREFVTFMLISNFAMWAINTFETQTPEHNPIQVDVYGIEAWAIFTHISVPLGIYYRFHSTVCMSNIWKNAWKMKKHV